MISPGTRLGPYEIVSRLGAGGMGEVWRARDTRLDRSVAVKLLAPDLAGNAQLKLRFEREAKTISQLNHPHICTLFDVGENYLVMELLEGESLAERLARGPLPLNEAIRHGAQIADALDRAHRAGIVHRDLKPGNVMITKSGAKLLDFGLAKPSTTGVAPEDATQAQRSLTAEGTLIGTFQYMAPEQLEGIEADVRTDIFALGVLLYEMVTGKRAFAGKTRTSLIAAIVGSDPAPIRDVLPLAPSALDHVVRTCMAKDPENRWQSAHDVANELLWIQSSTTADVQAAPRSKWAWPVAAVLALIAIAASALYVRERAKPAPPVAFTMLPPKGATLINAAVSPDGRSIALVTGEQHDRERNTLYVRRIDSTEATKLADRAGMTLIWSPDSQSIAYVETGKLMKVSAAGGKPEVICEGAGYGVGGAWNRKGEILFAPAFADGLYRVPAAGGEAVPVSKLDAKAHETLHGYPLFLSDDDHYLFLRHTISNDPNEIHAGSVSGHGAHTFVVRADALAGLWNGRVLFVRNGVLYAQRFDEKKLAVTGDPQKVIDDVAFGEQWASARVTVSHDGAIVYTSSTNAVHSEVGWYDFGGKLVQKLFEETNLGDLRPSRDDSRILVEKFDSRKGAMDVFAYDVARGVMTRVTSGLADNHAAVFSADGSLVYYTSDRYGMYDIFSQPDDGVGAPKTMLTSDSDKHVNDVSPDGSTLLLAVTSPKARDDIWIAPAKGGEAKPWIVSDFWDQGARFSPDGKWVTYQSDRSGRMEVYVVAFPNGRSEQVSIDGGRGPEFDNDGTHILFEGADRMISAAEVHPNGNALAIGKPVQLFQMPKTMRGWWAGRTSKRILGVVVSDPRDMVDVFNFVRGALR